MLGFAGWVGATRVDDHHHYPSDILAGMGIGLLWANVAYWSRFDLRGRSRAADDRAQPFVVRLAPGPGDAGVGALGEF
jgi:membrane-associated phospholipid phosphatase